LFGIMATAPQSTSKRFFTRGLIQELAVDETASWT
jgi:hypothetical protein